MNQPEQDLPDDEMVWLLDVNSLAEAEVIVSTLRAYGIHAHRNPHGRYEPHRISVAAIHLDDAKTLLSSLASP